MFLWQCFFALLSAFAITAIAGPLVIPVLRRLKFGQSIREEGPSWHGKKQGTPTMGGVMFIAGIAASTLIFGFREVMHGDTAAYISLAVAAVFGIIGFCDDYIKVVKKRNLGLTALQKIILQALTSAAFILYLQLRYQISTMVYLPFAGRSVDLGAAYYFFAMFAMLAIVNSANLTDGIDGLAASVTAPIALFFVFAANMRIGEVSYPGAWGTGIFAAAVTGGCIGFLLYNFHPAKVFMGDTGSLFLGGAVMTMAFSLNMPVIFVIVGLVYVIEALSVVLQVGWFKLTKKRLFKMSPIHHHFEMLGWSEVRIVGVFTAVTVLMCIIAYFGI